MKNSGGFLENNFNEQKMNFNFKKWWGLPRKLFLQDKNQMLSNANNGGFLRMNFRV